jgi:hypothetical protein
MALNSCDKCKTESADMRFLRLVSRHIREDQIRNRNYTAVKYTESDRKTDHKTKRYMHITRTADERRIVDYKLRGKREPGKPIKRWGINSEII